MQATLDQFETLQICRDRGLISRTRVAVTIQQEASGELPAREHQRAGAACEQDIRLRAQIGHDGGRVFTVLLSRLRRCGRRHGFQISQRGLLPARAPTLFAVLDRGGRRAETTHVEREAPALMFAKTLKPRISVPSTPKEMVL